jgi:TPR repeat protein
MVKKSCTQKKYTSNVQFRSCLPPWLLTQSDTKANELWALVAEKGHAKARYHLGHGYRNGEGDLAIDFKRCVKLWEQSAKHNFDLGAKEAWCKR